MTQRCVIKSSCETTVAILILESKLGSKFNRYRCCTDPLFLLPFTLECLWLGLQELIGSINQYLIVTELSDCIIVLLPEQMLMFVSTEDIFPSRNVATP